MGTFNDLTNQCFGKWIAVRRGPNSKSRATRWYCQCLCGRLGLVQAYNLVNGGSKQCRPCASRQSMKTLWKKQPVRMALAARGNAISAWEQKSYRDKQIKYLRERGLLLAKKPGAREFFANLGLVGGDHNRRSWERKPSISPLAAHRRIKARSLRERRRLALKKPKTYDHAQS